jgi:uncharacterized membrane protein
VRARTTIPLALASLVAAGAALGGEPGVVELGDDDVEVLDDGTGGGQDAAVEAGDEGLSPGRLVGRLHPATIHFGIAWAVLALPLALARMRWRGLGRTDLVVTAAAVAGAGVAVATGLIHAPDVSSRPGIADLVELHEHLALATLGVLSAALVARVVLDRKVLRALQVIYVILLAAALGLVLVTGHMGGKITFGEGFLPF